METYLTKLKKLFTRFDEIKLVYLFGSRANKASVTPMSDYDFAIYLNEKTDLENEKEVILELISEISLILKTNNVDVVLLNKAVSPLLKFNILKEGVLLYEKKPYKLLIEPRIYNEYFDFKIFSSGFNQ